MRAGASLHVTIIILYLDIIFSCLPAYELRFVLYWFFFARNLPPVGDTFIFVMIDEADLDLPFGVLVFLFDLDDVYDEVLDFLI